jgi:predicted tellurium resistance membrane protein TerC
MATGNRFHILVTISIDRRIACADRYDSRQLRETLTVIESLQPFIDFTLLASADAPATTQAASAPLWSFASLLALLTLTLLEVVLGIDNIVFISILVNKLPPERRDFARRLGLGLAMGIRILLLLAISWVMRLTDPITPQIDAFWTDDPADKFFLTGKDLVLLLGGLFLLWKATHEIHSKLEGDDHASPSVGGQVVKGFGATIVQILLIDIVFSLDSVITAVGMAQHIEIMIAAVVIAVGVMLVFSGPIAALINRHPTLQMLALSFLILIGVMLVVEAFHGHVPKGYIYFAMAFSVGVEVLNIRLRKKATPVQLHQSGYGA